MSKSGVNWVKSLPDHGRALNEEPKEELSWKSAFEIYYGRKPYGNYRYSQPIVVNEWEIYHEDYVEMISARAKDYRNPEKEVSRLRKAAVSKKCE